MTRPAVTRTREGGAGMKLLRPPKRPRGADPATWRTPLCECGHAWKRHAPVGCTECWAPDLGYPCSAYRPAATRTREGETPR
jgi:hypothetical protein